MFLSLRAKVKVHVLNSQVAGEQSSLISGSDKSRAVMSPCIGCGCKSFLTERFRIHWLAIRRIIVSQFDARACLKICTLRKMTKNTACSRCLLSEHILPARSAKGPSGHHTAAMYVEQVPATAPAAEVEQRKRAFNEGITHACGDAGEVGVS